MTFPNSTQTTDWAFSMATLITHHCQAYVNHGRWVADCPRPYCGNALKLTPNQAVFECSGSSGCGMVASINWPPDAQAIWDALMQRPVPATRNWIPSGHPYAAMGYPADQTPRELLDEQAEMERLADG